MRRSAFIASLAPLMIAAQAEPAAAGGAVCKSRSDMIQILSNKFGETQRSFGLQGDRRVLELYASANGTWTAVLSMPNGKSCVVAAGEAWTSVPPAPVGEPA